MNIFLRLSLATAPLLSTILFAWLVMEGHFNFGGGEKDVLLTAPLMIWSLGYLCSYLTLWWRRFTIIPLVVISSLIATGVVVAFWLILFGFTR